MNRIQSHKIMKILLKHHLFEDAETYNAVEKDIEELEY